MAKASSCLNWLLNFCVRVTYSVPFLHVFREPAFVEPSPLLLSAVPSNEERTHLFISLVKQPDIFILDRCLSLPLDVSMNRVIRHHISSTRHLGISRDSNESHALLPSFPFFLFLSPPSSTRKNALRSVAFSMYNYFRHVVFYPIFSLFSTFDDKASLKRCSFSTRPLNETFRTGYLLSAQNRSS